MVLTWDAPPNGFDEPAPNPPICKEGTKMSARRVLCCMLWALTTSWHCFGKLSGCVPQSLQSQRLACCWHQMLACSELQRPGMLKKGQELHMRMCMLSAPKLILGLRWGSLAVTRRTYQG